MPHRAESRMIAAMRFLLASSSFVIVWIDPSEPARYARATYAVLLLYAAWSGGLYALALRGSPVVDAIRQWWHWTDVGWYAALIVLSGSAHRMFFSGLYFAVLVASFTHGFRSGIRVTVASALVFTAIGVATLPSDPQFEWNQFLLHALVLVVLGYMFAYWGEFEILHRRRLALLRDLGALSNPRLGSERVLGAMLERIRAFYGADSAAVLIREDRETGGYELRRADGRDPERAAAGVPLAPDAARRMFAPPENHAVVFTSSRDRGWRRRAQCRALDLATGASLEGDVIAAETAAALLDAEAFVSAPVRTGVRMTGRFYVSSAHRGAFADSEADFLGQAVMQIVPAIENIRMLDRLASTAAAEAQRKILLDLHDTVLQPYIGLQIGLTGIARKIDGGDRDVSRDVKRLIEFADAGIADMRGSLSSVKEVARSEEGLLPAIRHVAARFAEATGIDVDVETQAPLRVRGQLAAEALQMVVEGLSNVRRHTPASRARVRLARREGRLFMSIENDRTDGATPPAFTPRSIAERAAALGGDVQVDVRDADATTVRVEVPL